MVVHIKNMEFAGHRTIGSFLCGGGSSPREDKVKYHLSSTNPSWCCDHPAMPALAAIMQPMPGPVGIDGQQPFPMPQ